MIKTMKFAVAGLALATVVAGSVAPVSVAQAEPQAQLTYAVNTPADQATLDKVQWVYGGRNYCWYGGGWRGPGWYWCGYAWRRGYGWGGPVGWHGWRYGPGAYRRGYWDHYHHWRHY